MNAFSQFEGEVASLAFRLLGERTGRYRNRGMFWKIQDMDRNTAGQPDGYSSALHIVFFDREGIPVRAIDQTIVHNGQPVPLTELESKLSSELDRMAIQN